MNQNDIIALFNDWNQALHTKDPKQVAALYDKQAILLPTLSNQVRHTPAEIEDYFVHFLAKGPNGTLNESNVRLFNNLAINSGIYTFYFKDSSSAQARFTFVYHWQNKKWMIVEHHSSLMPE